MTFDEEYRLSYYKKIAEIGSHKNVYLVQHTESKKIYVRKEHKVYNKAVYDYLKKYPSPNIPRIYECVEMETGLVIIEEYVQGDSLQDIYDSKGILALDIVIGYMVTICDVLEELHNLTIPVIHRDLKPENIIIQDNGNLKIIDFNSAKQYDSQSENDTVLIGTKNYAAPEQYGFKQSDSRTDIYALGVMMNYLLTGKYPQQYVYRNSAGKKDRISNIIEKCTAFDPSQRFQSIRELRRQLQPHKDYMIPGFRTRTPWKMITAVVMYFFIIVGCVNLTANDSSGKAITGIPLVANKVGAFGIFIFTIFFWFDYMNVQRFFPFMKSKKGKIVGNIIIPMVFMIIDVMIVNMFI